MNAQGKAFHANLKYPIVGNFESPVASTAIPTPNITYH